MRMRTLLQRYFVAKRRKRGAACRKQHAFLYGCIRKPVVSQYSVGEAGEGIPTYYEFITKYAYFYRIYLLFSTYQRIIKVDIFLLSVNE